MQKNRGEAARRSKHKLLSGMESLEKRIVLTASGHELPMELNLGSDQPDSALVASAHDASAALVNAVPRIVNGDQTGNYPAVGVVNDGCTGTLISPTHVLTAAHCVEGVGNTQGTFEVNGQTYNTVRITTHPNYNPNNFGAGSDLAIMELSRPVVGVQPMQILRTAPQVGQTLTLVGFGEGGTSTGGFDPNDEGKQVGQTELEEVTGTHIAWNFDNHNEANTAPGDSGGPAFVNIGGQLFIAGVTSGGNGDAQTLGDYSFDTRVDVFANWIDGVVGNVNPNPGPAPEPNPSPSPNPSPAPAPSPDPGDGVGISFSPAAEAQYELDVYDANNNGKLSTQELVAEFLDYGDSAADAATFAQWLIEDFDTDGNNQLSYAELVVSWGGEVDVEPDPVDPDPDPVDPVPVDPDPVDLDPVDPDPVDPDPVDPEPVDPDPEDGFDFSPEAEAQYELDVYDTDGNGKLSNQELVVEFIDYGDSAAEASMFAGWLIEDFDANGDQQLSYAELVASWGGELDGEPDPVVPDPVDPSPVDPDIDDSFPVDEVFGDDDWMFGDDDWLIDDGADYNWWDVDNADVEDAWADDTDWWSMAFALYW